MEELPHLMAMRRTLWYMNDGVPAYFISYIKLFLESHYPDEQTG
jgi:hypothetical protein